MASIECRSEVEAEDRGPLLAHQVKGWLEKVPDGAVVSQIIKDFGTQRDPDPTLVGLRARWSESR